MQAWHPVLDFPAKSPCSLWLCGFYFFHMVLRKSHGSRSCGDRNQQSLQQVNSVAKTAGLNPAAPGYLYLFSFCRTCMTASLSAAALTVVSLWTILPDLSITKVQRAVVRLRERVYSLSSTVR